MWLPAPTSRQLHVLPWLPLEFTLIRGFTALVLLVFWDWFSFVGDDCPGHGGMESGIPGLFPLGAGHTFPRPSNRDNEICLRTLPNVPWVGGQPSSPEDQHIEISTVPTRGSLHWVCVTCTEAKLHWGLGLTQGCLAAKVQVFARSLHRGPSRAYGFCLGVFLRPLPLNMSYKSPHTISHLAPLLLPFNDPPAAMAWFQLLDSAKLSSLPRTSPVPCLSLSPTPLLS